MCDLRGDCKSGWLCCLCAFAALTATRPAIAASPRQPAADYLRQAFTTEDGLPLTSSMTFCKRETAF